MERPLRFQQSANLAVASRRASERRPADTPVTFVCWSRRIGAFAGPTDITELFELPAWQSAINTRDNLEQAAVARHRAGSARVIGSVTTASGERACRSPVLTSCHRSPDRGEGMRDAVNNHL
jgi:hypothetical protein